MRISLISIFIFWYTLTNAQETKIASGTYIIRIEKNQTELEALSNAKEQAKINAIENSLGVIVSETNILQNKQTIKGNETNQEQVFNSNSSSLLNGEWVKTIWEKDSIYTDNEGYRWIKYQIKGEVRKILFIPFEPEVFTLNCPNLKCKTDIFKSDDNLFIYFKSPKSGFLSIYLNDGENTHLLLPYSKSEKQESYVVNGDQTYILFNPQENKKADLVELFTEKGLEINELIFLFSEKEIKKPGLESSSNSEKSGYILPKKLSNEAFEKWMQTYRGYEKGLQIKNIKIIIKPSK